MRKKTIVTLYILAVLLSVIAAIALIPFILPHSLPHSILMSRFLYFYHIAGGVVISIALFCVASVLGIIAWIGVLVKQGKQEQWVWFVCTLLFGGLVLLIYLLAVPERSPQLPVPGHGQVYQPQPPMYYPPNPPSYPSSPNDPRF